VKAAEEATLLDHGLGAEREPADVVDLHLICGRADPAAVHRPLALALVSFPHRPADMGGDIAGAGVAASAFGRRSLLRCRRLLARILHEPTPHEPTPLRSSLEKEIEAGLDDLVAGRGGVRVREGVARRLELLEEAARNRHVNARQLGVERLDRHWRRRGSGRGRQDFPDGCI
jgi:hypothetical protein